MPSFQPDPQSLFDSLYCQENHFWDVEESRRSGEIHTSSDQKPSLDIGQDDEELDFLLNKEQQELYARLEERPGFGEARVEAVEWILKVVEYCSFSVLTGILAVNYLDRFLHELQHHSYNKEKPWMAQLTAVACLSLAAKVEETHVPLPLDLQVEEKTKYLFETKTIQRMEVLILSKLNWRMNPVTPLPFLHHIARRLKLKGYFSQEFLRRSEFLLLYIVYDSRFIWHLPSAMATATMVYVMTTLDPSIGIQNQDQLMGILGIDKEKVKDCCRVIQEVATNSEINKRKMGSLPGSPKGVMEMSFSYDSGDSWTVNYNTDDVSSSPEQPSSKKIKSLTSDKTTIIN